jgi:(E)-4-hydroxy-3-methylbut-2-enyl-diphosphate synthase
VPQSELVDTLFAEIDKSLDRGGVHVDEQKSREGAAWLEKIEGENAGELTPERIAKLEAEAARTEAADVTGPDLADGEPYLKPVKRPALDEEDSPVAGRRFTRT